MNPNPNRIYTSDDNAALSGIGTTISRGAPPEGSEGVLPLPTHEAPNTDIETEKPSRAGQIGEGSYEGTDGYAKSLGSYLRTADAGKDAEAAAPDVPGKARELLDRRCQPFQSAGKVISL